MKIAQLTRLSISALAAALALTGPVLAQQQGGSDQRWAQEQARGEGTEIMVSPAGVRLIQIALNQRGYDAGNLTGKWNSQVEQAVRAYQAANGLEPTGTLTISLINNLGASTLLSGNYGAGEQNANQRWEQETAANSGVPIYASPAQVRQIQQAVNSQGYDCGQTDGRWGSQTSECVSAFQAANGLEPIGELTASLIAQLGGSQSIFGSGQEGEANQRWAQETAGGPGTEIWASPAMVRRVQMQLNQAGYNAGNLTGNWDSQTRQAARAYQASNNLEPTGGLTTTLLANLGMGQWYTGEAGVAMAQQGGGQGQFGNQGPFMGQQGTGGQQFGGQGQFGQNQFGGQQQQRFGAYQDQGGQQQFRNQQQGGSQQQGQAQTGPQQSGSLQQQDQTGSLQQTETPDGQPSQQSQQMAQDGGQEFEPERRQRSASGEQDQQTSAN